MLGSNCGYCGRFMRLVDHGSEWGTEWRCSQQNQHILDDPKHWSVMTPTGMKDAATLDPTDLAELLEGREL